MDRQVITERLAQTDRRVAEGRVRVLRQYQLIEQLERDGQDTTRALRLLGQYDNLLALHVANRDRLVARLDAYGPAEGMIAWVW
jgi:hypothetical protein